MASGEGVNVKDYDPLEDYDSHVPDWVYAAGQPIPESARASS
jgi:hypothetical protein